MKCPYCGAENSESSKYCSLCLKTFQTPAEIELAQEVRHKKEETINKKPKFKPLKFVVIMLVILGLSSIAYLGIKAARKSVGNDLTALTGVSTDKNGATIKKNIGGKSVEVSMGKLPEGFPNFPVYKGAKIKLGQRVDESGGKMSFLVMAETTAEPQKVIAYYRNYLSEKGYQVSDPAAEGNDSIGMLSFVGYFLTGKILVSDKQGSTSISITVNKSVYN